MPAIADPYAFQSYYGAHHTGRHTNPVRLRILTALHRDELTRALADGADPSVSDELALRAARLTSRRNRRTLTRSLRRTLREAHQPPMAARNFSIIRRGAVVNAEGAIKVMISRLESAGPIQPEGMAILERILTNADRSPLYNPCEPGRLRAVIVAATTAMGPDPSSHEFPVGV